MALSPIEGMLSQLAVQFLSNPATWEQLGEMFSGFGCHTAADVAIDALDAYKAGHLTKEQAIAVVQTCLSTPPGKVEHPTRQVQQLPVDGLNAELSQIIQKLAR
jgi:hypothetical protein